PTATEQGEILRVPSGEIRQLALSPDGKQIAAATSAGLWLYTLHVSGSSKLMDKTPVAAVWWSPTGNWLQPLRIQARWNSGRLLSSVKEQRCKAKRARSQPRPGHRMVASLPSAVRMARLNSGK